MTEPTADPSPETMVVPITVDKPSSGLLQELIVLLESQLSEGPLSLGRTTLTELRLDGDGWSPTIVAAAANGAAAGAAAGHSADTDGNKQPHYHAAIHITAGTDGNKQPHYYVAIHVTALREGP